jgi:hypothetical protein
MNAYGHQCSILDLQHHPHLGTCQSHVYTSPPCLLIYKTMRTLAYQHRQREHRQQYRMHKHHIIGQCPANNGCQSTAAAQALCHNNTDSIPRAEHKVQVRSMFAKSMAHVHCLFTCLAMRCQTTQHHAGYHMVNCTHPPTTHTSPPTQSPHMHPSCVPM